MSAQFETKRLRLLPHAPKHMLALIQSAESYERSFGAPPAAGLRDFIVSKEVSPAYLASLDHSISPDPWKHGFGLLHVDSGTVIGFGGFKGPPGPDGIVEIAYGVAPGFQGKGLATEAAEALVAYAFNSGLVRLCIAHTLPESNASTHVLTKCGFRHIGEVTDPEDGLVWRWEKVNETGQKI
jgi:RimJ/RimL family protein N-acetyltransferase